eukprot:788637-Amphidinium_carterae.1
MRASLERAVTISVANHLGPWSDCTLPEGDWTGAAPEEPPEKHPYLAPDWLYELAKLASDHVR